MPECSLLPLVALVVVAGSALPGKGVTTGRGGVLGSGLLLGGSGWLGSSGGGTRPLAPEAGFWEGVMSLSIFRVSL
jgi:hypothetical protein